MKGFCQKWQNVRVSAQWPLLHRHHQTSMNNSKLLSPKLDASAVYCSWRRRRPRRLDDDPGSKDELGRRSNSISSFLLLLTTAPRCMMGIFSKSTTSPRTQCCRRVRLKLKCKFLIGHDASSLALVLFVVGAAVSLAPSPRSKKVQGLLRPFCVAAGRGSSRADHHTLRAGGSRRQQVQQMEGWRCVHLKSCSLHQFLVASASALGHCISLMSALFKPRGKRLH